MSHQLRIRVEFNKGRVGMPMGKLSAATERTVRFLASLARDLGVVAGEGGWLAERFENGSVDFDCRLSTPLTDEHHERGRRALRQVFSNRFDDVEMEVVIRPETRRCFGRIAEALDADEIARFGLYLADEERPGEWFTLDRSRLVTLVEDVASQRRSWGEIQGFVHSFFKEVSRPYFKIRELGSRRLVNCYFKPEMYRAAVEVLTDPESVVYVEGWVHEDAETGFATHVEVSDFRLAPDFSLEVYRAGLGSLPDYTGSLSTAEHIATLRDNDE
jgi:hypothetical protein